MKNKRLVNLEGCLEPESLHVGCLQSQGQAKVSVLWEAKHAGDMTALVPPVSVLSQEMSGAEQILAQMGFFFFPQQKVLHLMGMPCQDRSTCCVEDFVCLQPRVAQHSLFWEVRACSECCCFLLPFIGRWGWGQILPIRQRQVLLPEEKDNVHSICDSIVDIIVTEVGS